MATIPSTFKLPCKSTQNDGCFPSSFAESSSVPSEFSNLITGTFGSSTIKNF